jgi:hypothetical protein
MMGAWPLAAALLAASTLHGVAGTRMMSRANPIRRVVTMLQKIEAKVQEEGEKEKELHEKYMCSCKSDGASLSQNIAAAEAKTENLDASLKAAVGQKAQLESDLKAHKSDRESAKAALAEAKAMREKEAAAYAATKAEADANIEAVAKAVAALTKGMGGSFLQTDAAQKLRDLTDNQADLFTNRLDRQTVTAFLASASDDEEDSDSDSSGGGSDEILGIMKQLSDEMIKDLGSATADENDAKTVFAELSSAKKREVSALTGSIEDKMTRVGDIGVEIVNMKNDASDTAKSMAQDKQYLSDLEKNCKAKAAEWEQISSSRAEELVALADTIKMLNDDDALELFKKAIPSASSFLQLQVTAATVRANALALIHAAQSKRRPHRNLDLIALILHGKTTGFTKVVGMIDEMVGVLQQEQVDDDKKKEWCNIELDATEDKKKTLSRSISDANTAVADAQETMDSLEQEIKATLTAIQALDASVAQATQQRKKENAAFKELSQGNNAAKELIGMAKNRLNKFYNPDQYKAPPKRELSEMDRINVNMGGTAPPTPAPGGIAGTGITAFVQVKMHRDSNAQKKEESNAVIAMLDTLVGDLEKENAIAEVEEKNAQADYEKLMDDSKTMRADNSKMLGDKEAAKADAAAAVQSYSDSGVALQKKLRGTMEQLSSLHKDCDWLLQNFGTRKEARSDEIDALGKAKAVLSGADYS